MVVVDTTVWIDYVRGLETPYTNALAIRKTADIIIGTFCIEHNFPLLHNDRDFEPMEKYLGLLIYKVA